MLRSFDEIAAAAPAPVEVEVPDWGCSVRLRPISIAAGMRLEALMKDMPRNDDGSPRDAADLERFYLFLLTESLDDDGFRTERGREFLSRQKWETLIELGQAALQVNGMTEEDAKKKSPTVNGSTPSSAEALAANGSA